MARRARHLLCERSERADNKSDKVCVNSVRENVRSIMSKIFCLGSYRRETYKGAALPGKNIHQRETEVVKLVDLCPEKIISLFKLDDDEPKNVSFT